MRGALLWAALVAALLLARAAYAQEAESPPDPAIVATAEEAGVDQLDLAGAVSATGLAPDAYLCAVGEGPCPPVEIGTALRIARVRLTHYWEAGVTYGGQHTYPGSAACSWNFALGTRFVLPTGEAFVCNDRGLLGSGHPYGWLDLYGVNRDGLGPYVTVEVLP